MKLYLIPTVLAPETLHFLPDAIGQLAPGIQHYFVENERTARRFLSELNVGLTIQDLHFYILEKKTKREAVKSYFQKIPKDASVGVISESGCPGIADPGAMAVEIAHQEGIEVIAIPGPSSIFLALMGSGMNGQSFTFHGYLPIGKDERKQAIKKLELDSVKKKQTQIFIETPYRNEQLFKDLVANCHPQTRICVACNLTAPDGFTKTLPANLWRKETVKLHKKPTVFLIQG